MDGRLNPTRFPVFLLKPSHYDDDGYVIRWRRSVIPSNTLAALYGLVSDCADRRVLGDDVAIECHGIDETNSPIDVHRITREITGAGGGLVAMVGVQSNQYPRALDLAREFRQAKIPVAIGGFHVSGCLAMLPGVPPDLQEAIDLGVSLFSGEAEEGLDEVLRDAASGTVRLIYDHLKDPLKSPPLGLLDRMLVIGRPENTASSSYDLEGARVGGGRAQRRAVPPHIGATARAEPDVMTLEVAPRRKERPGALDAAPVAALGPPSAVGAEPVSSPGPIESRFHVSAGVGRDRLTVWHTGLRFSLSWRHRCS